MLAPVLHAHVDELDALESKIQDDIDKVIASIDINKIFENPEAAMLESVKMVEDILVNDYMHEALTIGTKLARAINKRNLLIDNSSNPKENDDILNGKGELKVS